MLGFCVGYATVVQEGSTMVFDGAAVRATVMYGMRCGAVVWRFGSGARPTA